MYRQMFECTLAAALIAAPFPVLAQTRVGTAIPTRVGTCAFTRVTGVHLNFRRHVVPPLPRVQHHMITSIRAPK